MSDERVFGLSDRESVGVNDEFLSVGGKLDVWFMKFPPSPFVFLYVCTSALL